MALDRALVEEVLVPLVEGKTLIVRAPFDADDVDELIRTRVTLAGVDALGEATRRVTARFLYDAIAPPLDADAIRLGAAIHNLCWLMAQPRHDDTRGVMARVATYTARLARLERPVDEEALCARHAIVGGLRTLTREDVRVRYWAGEQTFFGESPPARLLRWQTVRRVREERVTVRLFDEALGAVNGKPIIAALLASSPLTDLVLLDRNDPPIDLRSATHWLGQSHIARAVADLYLSRGLPSVEASLVPALFGLYDGKSAEDDVIIATSFHSHLHLLDVLARPPRDRDGHLQILRGYLQGRDRIVADGFGLHAAADRVGLGRPADVARDAALEKNVAAYAEACAELVGARRLGELTGLVTRNARSRARVS